MSPVLRLRRAAVAATLLAVALRAAHTLWWAPRFRHYDAATDMLLGQIVPVLVILALTFGAYALVWWPHRRLPRGFDITAAGFVVPTSPANGVQAILAGFLGAGIVGVLQEPGGELTTEHGPWLGAGIAMAVLLTVAALWLWRGSAVVLSRDGVTVHAVLTRRIPWDALLPGEPDRPRGTERELWLSVNGPGGHRWQSISLRSLYADGAFLAAAIRHYAAHPEHRAAIGTPAELARLTAALEQSDAGTPADPGNEATPSLFGQAPA